LDYIYKNWNIEVGSPREFFGEIHDTFLQCGYAITEEKEPSLSRTAMTNVAEFEGYITSSSAFRSQSLSTLLVGGALFFLGLGLLWESVHPAISAASGLSSFSSYLVFEIVVGFILLGIGWSTIKASTKNGTISTTLKISGEAYQSRASARPDATTAHERSGIYSRAKLVLLLTMDVQPPESTLEGVRSSCSQLQSKVDRVASRYVILRDKMLSDSSSE